MKLYERLPDSITVDGRKYRLDLDFRNVLKMMYIMERSDILQDAKDYQALKCIMKRPPKDGARLLLAIRLMLFGIGSVNADKPVTNFEQDADLIRAAFMQEYNINLFTDKLHWFEFVAFLHGLPEGNKYTEVIGIRTRPIPQATKYNKVERETLIKAQAAYALKMTKEQQKQSYNKSLQRVFSDLKSIADRK